MRLVPEHLSTPTGNEKMHSTRLHGRAIPSAARAAIGIALAPAAIHAAPGAADTITKDYATPGTYSLTVPDHTTSVKVVAIGASGTDGGNAQYFSAGGAGGYGSLVNATLPVEPSTYIAPGDTLKVVVGSKG